MLLGLYEWSGIIIAINHKYAKKKDSCEIYYELLNFLLPIYL